MKIDPICSDPEFQNAVEIFCSGFPDGLRGELPEECDSIFTFERIGELGTRLGEPQDPESRVFWMTTFGELLTHFKEVMIKTA